MKKKSLMLNLASGKKSKFHSKENLTKMAPSLTECGFSCKQLFASFYKTIKETVRSEMTKNFFI